MMPLHLIALTVNEWFRRVMAVVYIPIVAGICGIIAIAVLSGLQ